jgi:uncharacterized membrane protein
LLQLVAVLVEVAALNAGMVAVLVVIAHQRWRSQRELL